MEDEDLLEEPRPRGMSGSFRLLTSFNRNEEEEESVL